MSQDHFHNHQHNHQHHHDHQHEYHLQRRGNVSRQSAGSELAGHRDANSTWWSSSLYVTTILSIKIVLYICRNKYVCCPVSIKIINTVIWVSQFVKICQEECLRVNIIILKMGSIFIETKIEVLHLLLHPDGGVRDEFIPQRGNERLSHKYHHFQSSSTPLKD